MQTGNKPFANAVYCAIKKNLWKIKLNSLRLMHAWMNSSFLHQISTFVKSTAFSPNHHTYRYSLWFIASIIRAISLHAIPKLKQNCVESIFCIFSMHHKTARTKFKNPNKMKKKVFIRFKMKRRKKCISSIQLNEIGLNVHISNMDETNHSVKFKVLLTLLPTHKIRATRSTYMHTYTHTHLRLRYISVWIQTTGISFRSFPNQERIETKIQI